MTDYASRITQPGSNALLRISDLIELLDALKQAHGDLWCYIYSADKRASVPMLSLNLDVKRTVVTFSAQTGSVVDEQVHDLIEEVERLRNLQPYDPTDACGGVVVGRESDRAAGAGEANR